MVLLNTRWSVTTQKHINYVARELGLTIEKDYTNE